LAVAHLHRPGECGLAKEFRTRLPEFTPEAPGESFGFIETWKVDAFVVVDGLVVDKVEIISGHQRQLH